MRPDVEGRSWDAVKKSVHASMGPVAVEWPGDTPRPSSPVPRIILDCSGTVLRIEQPRVPRYPFEGVLGPSADALRRPSSMRAAA